MIKTDNIQNQVVLEMIQKLKIEVIQLQQEDRDWGEQNEGVVSNHGNTKIVRDFRIKQSQIRSEITKKKNQIIDLILKTDLI